MISSTSLSATSISPPPLNLSTNGPCGDPSLHRLAFFSTRGALSGCYSCSRIRSYFFKFYISNINLNLNESSEIKVLSTTHSKSFLNSSSKSFSYYLSKALKLLSLEYLLYPSFIKLILVCFHFPVLPPFNPDPNPDSLILDYLFFNCYISSSYSTSELFFVMNS